MNKTCHGIARQFLCSFTPFHKLNPFHFIIHFIHIITHHPSSFIPCNISLISPNHSIPWLKCSTGTVCSSTDILQLISLSAARQSFRSYKFWRHQPADIRIATKWSIVSMNKKHQEELWRLFQRWTKKTKTTKIKWKAEVTSLYYNGIS